ncbi:MAG: type II toxin-antitoxin system RelE/ParE family toxin [Anaerolineae bacterium]
MYRVEAARTRVKRQLKRIPKSELVRIGTAVKTLGEEPRPPGAIQLHTNIYRIRIGNYRIIYKVYDEEKLVLIGRVVRRSEITYKGIGDLFD